MRRAGGVAAALFFAGLAGSEAGGFACDFDGVAEPLAGEVAVRGLGARVLDRYGITAPTEGHGGGDFVDVLAARAGASGEGFFEFVLGYAEFAEAFVGRVFHCARYGGPVVIGRMGNVSYESAEREGKTVDYIEEEGTGLRLGVCRKGAEPISLSLPGGSGERIGFLHRDDDSSGEGWKGHCPLMGYFIHRLKEGTSVYGGEPVAGGTHSFLRAFEFRAPERIGTGLAYRVEPEEIPSGAYPRRVALEVRYELDGGAWRTTFAFENREPERDAHVSFGLHPAFRAASPEAAEVHMPPGRYRVHHAPGNFLDGTTADLIHGGGPMPFRREGLPGAYLLELVDVELPLFVFRDTGTGREVDCQYAGAPYVTLWNDGSAFLCIEPCWGLPDHWEQRRFEDKAGIQIIPAGGELVRGFTITPRLPRAECPL